MGPGLDRCTCSRTRVVKDADSFHESHTLSHCTQPPCRDKATPLLCYTVSYSWLPRDHPTSNTLVDNSKTGERNTGFTS